MDIIFVSGTATDAKVLSEKQIRDIFLGDKTTWDDGTKIYFAVIRKGPVHEAFLEKYIGMSGKDYARYWKRQILTGKATTIKLYLTEAQIVEYVSRVKGSIGYVSSDFPIDDLTPVRITDE